MLFAGFCLVLFFVNSGCTMFGTGLDCEDVSRFQESHYVPMQSWTTNEPGMADTPAARVDGGMRTAQIAREGFVSIQYRTTDGLEVVEEWEIIERRIVSYDDADYRMLDSATIDLE